MKRFSSLLIVLSLALASLAQAATNDATAARKTYGVAFYNLENLFDTINSNGRWDLEFSPNGKNQWDSKKYAIKINNLANAIANLVTPMTHAGPAIIGVAEVENIDVMRDLANAAPLRNRNLGIVHHDSPDPRGIDVALFYDPEQFEVLNVTTHFLYVDDDPDFRTRDQLCVTGLLGNDSLSVIVNHWPSRLGGQERSEPKRAAAAELTRHIADSLWAENPWQGIIVMGDLNDDPADKSVAKIVGGHRDIYDVGPHDFFNPWWSILDHGKGTLTYRGQWNLFDQILVSGTLLRDNGATLLYDGAEIMDIEFLKQTEEKYRGMPWRTFAGGRFLGGYSDHFPTQVFLVPVNSAAE